MTADYSQIEMRIMAHLSNGALIEAFRSQSASTTRRRRASSSNSHTACRTPQRTATTGRTEGFTPRRAL